MKSTMSERASEDEIHKLQYHTTYKSAPYVYASLYTEPDRQGPTGCQRPSNEAKF